MVPPQPLPGALRTLAVPPDPRPSAVLHGHEPRCPISAPARCGVMESCG